MVISADVEEARRRNLAGLTEKRTSLSLSRRSIPQSRLHNFSFPNLNWGNQKLLRCVNSSDRLMDEELLTARRCSPSSSPNELPPPPRFHRQKQGSEEGEAKESNPSGPSASRPWNLRSRRAARNVSAEVIWNRNPSPSSSQSPSTSHSPLQMDKTCSSLNILNRLDGLDRIEKGQRRKFSIALSKEEIEEDFLAAKGTKPPRRAKKRAKYLQRQLDVLFPGVLLSEVTSDMYKIEEIGS